MAKYTVTASDGRRYNVEAPEGVPEELLRMDLDRQLARAAYRPPETPEQAPETSVGGAAKEFFKGIPRGAIDLLETAGIGATAALPESLEEPSRRGVETAAEFVGRPFEVAPGYEDSVMAQLGTALGSTVPFLAAGPAGAAGRVAATALGGASGAGIARERAEQSGATDEERALATAAGVAPGLAEVLVPFRILDNVIGTVPAQGIVNRLRRAATAGGQEGLQEAASEIAQNLIAKGVYDPEQGVFTGTGESFGYGAGVGGLLQGLLDLVAPTRGGRNGTQPQAGEEAQEGETQVEQEVQPTPIEQVSPEERTLDELLGEIEGTRAEQDAGVYSRAGNKVVLDPTEEPRRQRQVIRDLETEISSDLRPAAPTELETALDEALAESDTVRQRQDQYQNVSDTLDAVLAETTGAARQVQEDQARKQSIAAIEADFENARQERIGQQVADRTGRGVEGQLEIPTIETTEAAAMRLGQPVTEQAAPGVAAFTPITAQDLIDAGVPKSAPIVRTLPQRDLSTPEAQEQLQSDLFAYANNPIVRSRQPEVSERVKDLAQSVTPATPAAPATPASLPEMPAAVKQSMEGRQRKADTLAQNRMQLALDRAAALGVPDAESQTPANREQQTQEPVEESFIGDEYEAATRTGPGYRTTPTAPTAPAAPQEQANPDAPTTPAEQTRLLRAAVNRDIETMKPHQLAAAMALYTGEKPSNPKEAIKALRLPEQVEVLNYIRGVVSQPLLELPGVDTSAATRKRELDSGTIEVDGKQRPTTNSNGQPIHPTEEGVRNFWKWFGDSKVVDEQGRPLVVYHGTMADFDSFDPNAGRGGKKGFYFSPDTTTANAYAGSGSLIPAYLSIKNPKIIESKGWWKKLFNKREYSSHLSNKNIQEYRDQGYDGIINKDLSEIIAFSPEQIKSAIGNQGTFDPATPNITKSEAEPRRVSDKIQSQNRAFAERVARGDGPIALLDAVIANPNTRPDLKKLAQQLRRVSGNVNYTVTLDSLPGKDIGEFKANARGPGRMRLDADKQHDLVQTFLHEHVHALTSFAILTKSGPGRRMIQLYDQYKQQFPDSDQYGLRDADEFVSEALTNKDFQQFLMKLRPDGSPASMWERFIDTIKRILGLPHSNRTVEELLDLTRDAALMQEFDVPNFIRMRTEEYMQKMNAPETSKNAKDMLDLQGRILKSQYSTPTSPGLMKAMRDLMSQTPAGEVTSGGPFDYRRIVAWGMGLPSIEHYTRTALVQKDARNKPFADAVSRFTQAVVTMEGSMRQFIDAMTPLSVRMGEWKRQNPDKVTAFADLYFGGTEAKVDLTKDRSVYAKMPDKLKAYDKLFNGPWKEIGPSGQALYRQMRALHNRQFKEMVTQVYESTLAATKDKTTAKAIADEFKKKMESGDLEGYAPMVRPDGSYLIRYMPKNAKSEQDYGFEILTTDREWKARIAELRNDPLVDPDSVVPRQAIDRQAFEGMVPGSFVAEVMRKLDAANIKDPAVKQNLEQSVMSIAISMSPSSVLMKRMAERKGVTGYKREPFEAFQQASVGLGSRLTRLKDGADMQRALRDVAATRENNPADPETAVIHDSLKARAEYVANPTMPAWSNAATALTYLYTLGFNVSSAVVDMTSYALVTFPYLMRFNKSPIKVAGAMTNAMKTLMGTGTTADIETVITQGLEGAELQAALDTAGLKGRDIVQRKAMPSWLNLDFSKPDVQQKFGKYEQLANAIRASGQSERYSELSESVEFGEGNFLSKWAARMGFMMNASERFKREAGMTAMYDLELDNVTGGKPDSATATQREVAAQKALDMSLITNGGATAMTGPRAMQGPITRVAFMYRRWALSQLYVQFSAFREAFADADPETRAAAKRQLVYMYATSGALVGAIGMPMMGSVEFLFNALLVDDEDGEDDWRTTLHKVLPLPMVEGVFNAMANTNVSDRASLTNLLVRDTFLQQDATLADQIAAHFGGPAYGTAQRVINGWGQINDGNIYRGFESMLPAAIGNLLRSARIGTEGPTTLRGDPVTSHPSFAGAVAQFMGFAPADYARAVKTTVRQTELDRAVLNQRTKLMERYYMAYRQGDGQGMLQALNDIMDFNQRNAARKADVAISMANLKQSVSARERTTREMIMGSLPSDRRRLEWEEDLRDMGMLE